MRAGAAVSREEDVRLAARDAATRALDAAGLDDARLPGGGGHAGAPRRVDGPLRRAARRGGSGRADRRRRHLGRARCIGDAESRRAPRWACSRSSSARICSPSAADLPDELRGAARRAGPGALGIVFADPEAPVQRLLGALGRPLRVAGGGVAVEGGLLLGQDLAYAHAVGAFFATPGRRRGGAIAPADRPARSWSRVPRDAR